MLNLCNTDYNVLAGNYSNRFWYKHYSTDSASPELYNVTMLAASDWMMSPKKAANPIIML